MTVKRYSLWSSRVMDLTEDPNGRYVLASDYAALEADLTQMEGLCNQYRATNDSLRWDLAAAERNAELLRGLLRAWMVAAEIAHGRRVDWNRMISDTKAAIAGGERGK